MSKAVVDLLLAFCYVIIIGIITAIAAFCLMNKQAKKVKVVKVRADSVTKDRKRFVKPIRIALISDMHIPRMPPSKESVLLAIELGVPDYVVVAGDLCNEKKRMKEVAEFVGEIAKRTNCKVFVVMGNHDIDDACEKNSSYLKEYIKMIEASDYRVSVLVDDYRIAECRGTERKVLFGGLNDYRHSDNDKIKALCEKWCNKAAHTSGECEFVLVAHNPDSVTAIAEGDEPTVALCGHTHGGQMWLPFNFEFKVLRKDVLPGKGYKYGLKLYEKRFPIYITSGVGCTFLPIRFRTNAEVSFVDI